MFVSDMCHSALCAPQMWCIASYILLSVELGGGDARRVNMFG